MLDPDPFPRATADTSVGGDATCPEVPCLTGTECVEGECVVLAGCVDLDRDGYGPGCELGTNDCDERSSAVNPAAVEVCNGIDDDCDFETDEGGVCAPCSNLCTPGQTECSGPDLVRCDDSSGCAEWTSPAPCPVGLSCAGGACVETCTDADNDGFPVDCPGEREDCDDTTAARFPRHPEACDGLDNDCDGAVDENGVCEGGCEDECAEGTLTCNTGGGNSVIQCVRGADGCTRWDESACPSTMSCVNGLCVTDIVCEDRDGDGATDPAAGCPVGDCRPYDPTAYPGAAELCNGIDDDCDGVVDDGGVCASCPAATAAAPLSVGGTGSVSRVACSSSEFFQLAPSMYSDVSVVALGDGDVSVALGTLSGGVFRTATDGWALGAAAGVAGILELGGAVRVSTSPGTRYVLAVANETAVCVRDPFESNGAPAAGSPMGAMPAAMAATLCPGDFDFYRVDALRGQTLTAAASFDGDPGGDALVKVWWNGAEVSISHPGPFIGGSPAGRYTHFRTDLPGTYVVGVRGPTTAAETGYALAVSSSGTPCSDDSGETADGLDDDTIGTARALAAGGSTSGTLCPGDIDVLDVGELARGTTYSGTLTIRSGSTDVDFYLVRGSLRSLLHDGTGDEVETTFSTNISTAGRYYVVIHGRTPDATASYTYTHTAR